MRFLNSVIVPKNIKGGTLCNFVTFIVLQNIETNEGGQSFCAIQKVSKSLIVPKKSGAILREGGSLCVFEVLDVCFVFSFRFGHASEVGVVEV